jgi:hypothetical protein
LWTVMGAPIVTVPAIPPKVALSPLLQALV